MADRIIEKINEGVRLIKNNLNKDDLNILLNYAKNVDESLWNKNQEDNEFWSGRYIHYDDIENDEVKKVMISLMARINKAIRLEYNIDNQVYSDLLQFVRLCFASTSRVTEVARYSPLSVLHGMRCPHGIGRESWDREHSIAVVGRQFPN